MTTNDIEAEVARRVAEQDEAHALKYFGAAIIKRNGREFYVEFRISDGAISQRPVLLDQEPVTHAKADLTLSALVADGFTATPVPRRPTRTS